MEVVICGAGSLGYNIARYLIEENNNVTVVDTDPSLIAKINENLDCRGIVGHASAPSTWEKIGSGADLAIAVTRDDEVNMMACKVAHHLFHIPKKIARIREQSYLNPKWRALFDDSNLPIDLIISPEKEVAKAIMRRVYAPGATDIVPLHTPNVSLVGCIVADDSPMLQDTIERVVAAHEHLAISIMAIVHTDSVQVPQPNGVLKCGDEVYFVCPDDNILDALALFGHEQRTARDVLIIGGGNVGGYLAEDLSDDCKITVVESDPMVARKLAEKLPRSVVIQGDALKPEVLSDATVHQKHICISVSSNDEVNLISSLHASEAGVDRTICLLNNAYYETLARKVGISVTVHPMEVTGSIVLQSTRHGAVKNLYSLQENTAEIVEMEVSANAQVVGTKLRDLKMFRGSYIGMVIRKHNDSNKGNGDGRMILPNDSLKLHGHDRIIMLISPRNINRIIQMFTDDTYI